MDELRINHEFAKKYDKYRKAEEMQRLKDRYGNADALESSSSESEDEMAEAINPRLEKDFFNTLAILKRKDKEIYDKDKNFFKESPEHLSDNDSSDSGVHENRKTEKPFLLRDYERKVVLEKAGCYEDEGEDHTVGSYSHELNEIKRELKQATMEKDEKQSDEEADDFLTKKSQSSIVDTKVELLELDEYWTKPDLSKDEKFLRDYILDRKYLDTNELELDGDYDNQDEDEDEDMFVSKQENFEHKFNFRYQEPDSEFIKSYPRTIANSVRKTNDKTKIKRESRKTRKEEEKRKKMEELKRLKQLKREEILEKVSLLQKAAGNTEIKFTDNDIDGEFDLEEYDQRMKSLFDEEFYSKEEEEKPEFSDLGEDFDYEEDEDWDQYDCAQNANDEQYIAQGGKDEHYTAQNGTAECEQTDFNMDCDYDETAERSRKKRVNPTKAERKRKKSAFYEAVAKKKPLFNPDEKSFSEYLDEYYAMDFEDLIGDMPCRFKYRKVARNDFGLTTDEILNSDNRTLNSWCSLKQVVQRRNEDDENYLHKKFQQLAKMKKRKHFEKFQTPVVKPDAMQNSTSGNTAEENPDSPKIKKNLNSKQRRRKRERERRLAALQGSSSRDTTVTSHTTKRKRTAESDTFRKLSKIDADRLAAYGLQPKKVLKKAKYA